MSGPTHADILARIERLDTALEERRHSADELRAASNKLLDDIAETQKSHGRRLGNLETVMGEYRGARRAMCWIFTAVVAVAGLVFAWMKLK